MFESVELRAVDESTRRDVFETLARYFDLVLSRDGYRMDANDVGGRGGRALGDRRSIGSRRRGVGCEVESLEGRTLLSATINEITALPGSLSVGPMVVARDASLWFAEAGHAGAPTLAKLGASGRLTETALPKADQGDVVEGLAADASGNIWFTLAGSAGGKVGKVGPDGTITEYPLADGAAPGAATAGPGGFIDFALSGGAKGSAIGRITLDGVVTTDAVPGSSGPVTSLTVGADGNVWFLDHTRVGRIDSKGTVEEFVVPGPSDGSTFDLSGSPLVLGPDGNLWFIGVNGLVKVAADGTTALLPTPSGKITSLSSASDGNLWISFVPAAGSPLAKTPGAVVARMSIDGQTTVVADRVGGDGSSVANMVPGIDASIWLNEGNGKIGRLSILSVPALSPPIIAPVNIGVLSTDSGKTVSGTIAKFEPNYGGAQLSDFAASIDWGDGTVTGASISTDPKSGFDVLGTHTYANLSFGAQQQANITVSGPNGAAATIFAVTRVNDPSQATPWHQYPATVGTTTAAPSPVTPAPISITPKDTPPTAARPALGVPTPAGSVSTTPTGGTAILSVHQAARLAHQQAIRAALLARAAARHPHGPSAHVVHHARPTRHARY